jgi:exosortase K
MSGGGGARGEARAAFGARIAPGAARVACAAAVHAQVVDGVRTLRANAGVFAAGAAAAYAAKSFYAGADAEALRFVLAPTAALAELASGVRFEPELGSGYLSRERAYLIAPACAGLNFTIAAFSALVLGFAPRFERGATRAAWLLAAAALAFAVTPPVNAARIALDLALRDGALPAWLPAAQAHRLEGVAVYLGAIWGLCAGVARCFAERAERGRLLAVAVVAYLAVSVLVPLLNGGHARPQFWRHAAPVLATSLALGAAGALAVRYASRRRA